MPDVEQVPGGNNDGSGGAGGQPNDNPDSGKPSTVSREAYEKAITEAKKAKEKLQAIEAESKKRQEDEAKAKEDYKKLYESAAAERDEVKKQKSDLETGLIDGKKLQAFLGKLPGKVAKEYWSLIDLDKIVIDPDSREIDERSLAKAVKEFETIHARLIDKPATGRLPNDAPGGNRSSGFEAELAAANNQKELDAVMKKYKKV